MAAVYPGTVREFQNKQNTTDIIDASHPNLLQDEVTAIQTTLGANPQVSTTPSGTFSATTTDFGTVTSRLANIERGVVGDTHSQYVKVAGGSTIQPAAGTTVPLVVRGAASQSANLQEWRNSSGALLAYVSASGILVDAGAASDIDNLSIVSWVFG